MLGHRTRTMHDFLARQAEAGVQPWSEMWATGHGDAWRADADYTEARETAWAAALLS